MQAETLQGYILGCCEKHSGLACCKEIRRNQQFTYSYEELLLSLRKTGSYLSALKTEHGHAALLGRTSFEWIASYLGALCYGITAIPLNAGAKPEELLEQFIYADADVLIYDAAEEETAAVIARKTNCILIRLNDPAEEAGTVPETKSTGRILPTPPGNASRVAEILFTSGTTGKQKAVMLTEDNILCSVLTGIESFSINPSSTVASVMPNHHAYELATGILTPLHYGAAIATTDRMTQFFRSLKIFRPEVILAVPALLETLKKETERKRDSGAENELLPPGGKLETLVCGGAALREDLATYFRGLGVTVLQGYGLTECGPIVSCDSIRRQNKLGKVSRFCQVKSEDGEILVRGRNVMAGYYKDPEETARAVRDGWFHTGDLGGADSEGYISLTGRIKNLIILSNGENVSPEEIENLLRREETIAECMVYGEDDLIAAEIYPEPDYVRLYGEAETEKAIRNAVSMTNRSLPKYKQIEHIRLRQEPFRMTSTRKIIRDYPREGEANGRT